MQERSRPCAASRKWPALEPWCEFLRMTTRVRLTTDSNDELMVVVRLHPRQYWRTLSPKELVLMCREALELLAMLAVVDAPSWQQLLVDRCGCEKHKFWDDWAMPPRFWLKLGDSKAASDCPDTDYYRVFFCDFDVDSPKRAKFRAAAMKIQNAMTSAMHFDLARFDSFPVFVQFVPRRAIKTEENSDYLNGVVDVVKAALLVRDQVLVIAASAKTIFEVAVRPGRLVLDDIEVHTSRLTLPSGSSQILSEIMKLPVQSTGLFGGLNIGFDTVIGRLPATEFEPILTAMANHSSAPSSVKNENGVPTSPNIVFIADSQKCRTFKSVSLLTQRWKAVCSAYGVARHADEFATDNMFGDGNGTRAKKYQWLAYSLLSKESATSVSRLSICDLDFYQGDINAFLSILNAKNPASKLGGLARTPSDYAQLSLVQYARGENMPNDAVQEPAESDDESSEDEYAGDTDTEIEARVQALINAALNGEHGATPGQVPDLAGNGNGEAGLAATAGVNVVEGDATGEADTNDDADNEANAADNDDEDDGNGDSDGNEDIGGEGMAFHNQLLGIAQAAGMFGFDPFDPNDFDGDDDDPELDDEPGIEDEDPDVRAYYGEIAHETGEQEHGDGSVVLKKATTVRIDGFSTEDEGTGHESLVLKEDGTFRVIANDSSSELVNIIVPGYGSCSVERDSVDHFVPVLEIKTPSSLSLGYQGTITSLRLSFLTMVNARVFLPLLQYLGTKLTCLELDEEVYMTADVLNQVLEQCPHLKTLLFCASQPHFQSALVTAYAEGRCRMSKLHIGRILPGAITGFIEALQTPTTAIALTLKKLTLLHERTTLFGETTLAAIVDMLQRNTILEYFEIDLYPEEAQIFKPQLLAFHGQALPGIEVQLPLPCRLAFLSVLKILSRGRMKESDDGSPDHKRQRVSPTVDLERIDQPVLSSIILFAAQRRIRRIRVHVPDDDRDRFFHERYLREQADSDDEVASEAGW